jgi:Tfp pilus assembly protein PilN
MIKINLVEGISSQVQAVRRAFWGIIAFLGVCLALAVLARIKIDQDLKMLAALREVCHKELVLVSEMSNRVQVFEKEIQEAESKISAIQAIQRTKLAPTAIIQGVLAAVPEQAWLTEIRETDQGIKIVGLARDGEVISSFVRALGFTSPFVAVTLDGVKQSVRDGEKLQEFVLRSQITFSRSVDLGDSPVVEKKLRERS